MLLTAIIAFPLAGTLLLSFGYRMPERLATCIGVGSIGLAALAAMWVAINFLAAGSMPIHQHLWTWISVGDFNPTIALYLDGLSLTMAAMVTGVSLLIHWFSVWYMHADLDGKRGYVRFFAYMNLFVFSMLVLVLADNLLLLYLGWEGVGLCSYLLIGYYYHDTEYAWAAFKAFIVTRAGDAFLAIALFILYVNFGTLNIQELMTLAPQMWQRGDLIAQVTALLILGGAVGKSAQLPLQTWLPDAMAGPTPVSALIHAATMVTAGVYLIARTHVLFELAPVALEIVGIVGALTLLLAGFAALCQTDIKRVLAYSTISQIGYMFVALGVGAWDAAIFHLIIHAFFKGLLFLVAGSVIIACHHEKDILRMGGLRHTLKLDYLLFLIGGAALSALPLVSAGFYSKDEILWKAFAHGHQMLWAAGLFGALLTAIYTFRMIFIVFHGAEQIKPHTDKSITRYAPLIVLGILSTFIGALIHPPLANVFPSGATGTHGELKLTLEIITSVIAVLGLGIAAALFLGSRERITRARHTPAGNLLWRWWHSGWGFDWLYDRSLVQPYLALVKRHQRDWMSALVNLLPTTSMLLNKRLSLTQNGQLQHYAMAIVAAATLLIALLLWW